MVDPLINSNESLRPDQKQLLKAVINVVINGKNAGDKYFLLCHPFIVLSKIQPIT